ncbi:uroporphyrinogen-III synthase [Acidovorax sp. HDW3]|uniref:uroporphyrinogen-III synthase n=1 Tax=Acidovorax sp. HDW3 TaxID=2714923 RepID=UPI00140E86EF|nr:uroporphyrinogen-III synthase [Acidovorax sp. HDW3]QIL44448.1 uroporphyrinogen-III synthase [Acidovorax sp. HDW3]
MAGAQRVIVTRPQPDAAQWVQALGQRDIAAAALPLIAIGPSPQPVHQAQLQTALAQLAQYRAVMFVSGNAAHYFLEQKNALTLMQQALAATNLRAWTPGPGTAQVLLARGLEQARIDGPAPDAAQYDSEALWAQVATQITPGARVLIVRGCQAGQGDASGQGRDWLAAQLRAAGATVDFAIAYQRSAPVFSPEQQALAHAAASDGSLWLFSSSEAVTHLQQALPTQNWARAQALATHPRIAQAVRAAGFGLLHECKPAFTDVVASIESAL